LYAKLLSKYLELRLGGELKEVEYGLLKLFWEKEMLLLRVVHELLRFYLMAVIYFENLEFLSPFSIFKLFVFAFLIIQFTYY
jgi:hypothetical protein